MFLLFSVSIKYSLFIPNCDFLCPTQAFQNMCTRSVHRGWEFITFGHINEPGFMNPNIPWTKKLADAFPLPSPGFPSPSCDPHPQHRRPSSPRTRPSSEPRAPRVNPRPALKVHRFLVGPKPKLAGAQGMRIGMTPQNKNPRLASFKGIPLAGGRAQKKQAETANRAFCISIRVRRVCGMNTCGCHGLPHILEGRLPSAPRGWVVLRGVCQPDK